MKTIFRNILLLTLILSSLGFQQNYDTNAKIKAVFLYNFTRYFEWPESMKEGAFVIHIVGKNSNLVNELTKMSLTKMVGNQKIEVKNTNSLDPTDAPNVLFLLQESSALLQEACTKCRGKGTLIITERAGLARGGGAAINFVVADNKQKFEYNKGNAIKAGLKTSEEFKDLAITVSSK